MVSSKNPNRYRPGGLRTILIVLIMLGFKTTPWTQVEAYLSLENQGSIGSDYYFDIYINRTSNAGLGDIYLGNADFVIDFDDSVFNNPNIFKIGPTPGYCTFTPTLSDPGNDQFTRITYYNNTSVSLIDDKMVINLSSPNPGDQIAFNTSIAKIDDAMSTHCLGRFKITGLSDPQDDPDLKWKTKGTGLKTILLTLANLPPFTSSQVILETDSNTCPDSLEMIDMPIISGHYQAGVQFTLGASVEVGSTVTLTSGDHLLCQPNFEVPLGATVEIAIQGCQ